MKKRIVSLLLLGIYFFGGFGVGYAIDLNTTNNVLTNTTNTFSSTPTTTPASPTQTQTNINNTINPPATTQAEVINNATINNAINPPPPTTTQSTIDAGIKATNSSTSQGKTSILPTGGPNDMTSTEFRLNPNDLSPSEKKYTGGTKTNFKILLANIGKYLLIATTTLSVLSIVVGGLIISTTGPSDRAAKGKTIIVLNITAIVIALFSYSIIQLVSWLIA
ncbi:MAG: hypothetical protein WC774_02005 [Candidatus Gracilibacteria bacterium]